MLKSRNLPVWWIATAVLAAVGGGFSPAAAQCANQLQTFTSALNEQGDKLHEANWVGQTFVAPGTGGVCLNRITIEACKVGSPTDPLRVEIHSTSGSPGVPPLPGTAVPIGAQNVPAANITTACGTGNTLLYGSVTIVFDTPPQLTGGTLYAAVFRQATNGGSGNIAYRVGMSDGNPYSAGQFCRSGGGTWACPGSQEPGNPGTRDIKMTVCTDACPGGAIPSCTNTAGSQCCSQTQGAYGAPNSNATCNTANCNTVTGGLGYIPADGNVFTGDPNQTTIGVHGTKSVTIDNLTTLIAYLPAGGTPGPFGALVGTDTHYSAPGGIPDANPGGTNSSGQGAGTLAGQTMACRLNAHLSSSVFPTLGAFGSFQLPGAGVLLCTKRAGPDKILGTSDDVCQAFSYPACTAGLTVSAVQAAANTHLATGANGLGCSASDLNNALSNINEQFDNCGQVIACPGSVTSAGEFACPP